MTKFIELHPYDGGRRLVNIGHIADVIENNGNTASLLQRGIRGEFDIVIYKESYNTVRRMISSATGGIPMGDYEC